MGKKRGRKRVEREEKRIVGEKTRDMGERGEGVRRREVVMG